MFEVVACTPDPSLKSFFSSQRHSPKQIAPRNRFPPKIDRCLLALPTQCGFLTLKHSPKNPDPATRLFPFKRLWSQGYMWSLEKNIACTSHAPHQLRVLRTHPTHACTHVLSPRLISTVHLIIGPADYQRVELLLNFPYRAPPPLVKPTNYQLLANS